MCQALFFKILVIFAIKIPKIGHYSIFLKCVFTPYSAFSHFFIAILLLKMYTSSMDYNSFIVLYKPEHLLMNPDFVNKNYKWQTIIKDFVLQNSSPEKGQNLVIYSQQEKYLREILQNKTISIIGDDVYHTLNPLCIYYLKDDVDIENELKKSNTKIMSIDSENNIEIPEWAKNDIIFDGDYAAEKCNETYIFSKTEDFNILNNMLCLKKPIFILGERGSGKTTIIQNYINKSYFFPDDKNKKIVSIACGTLEPNLAKSELFGHTKGAFTGAEHDKTGAIKEADGGILYLDEIQDLSKEIQRMLIKVIEEHKFYRIGDTKLDESNFLLICSSNKSLNELKDILYDDFYDRISTFQYKIKSIEEQKLNDKDFISRCLPYVWRNYREKCVSKNQFFDYNQLDEFYSQERKSSIKDLIISALNRNTLKGNYRDIEKLLGYIELYALNARLFSTFPDKNQITKNIELAIKKWESDLQERNSFSPNLTEAFIEKQTWEGINKMFKSWIAEQAVNTYGSATAAAKALKVDKNSILKAKKKTLD